MAGVAIKNLTRQHLKVGAGALFTTIAREVLPGWEISLAFVGATRARALNKRLRNKEYVPNVLSYALGDTSAEIIICPAEAAKQAPAYNLPTTDYLLLLFIHGLLHIKGGVHGATMERSERKLLAKYAPGGARSLPNETTHRNRNRHRHVPGENGRGRRTRR